VTSKHQIRTRKGRLVAGLALSIAPFTLPAAEPLAEGQAQFDRACASCHGAGGTGGRGPSLRKQLAHGNQASDIRAVVVNGLPGTGMPKFHFDPDELKPLVLYVQSLSRGGGSDTASEHGGDSLNGRRVYERSGCAGCHKIAGEGSAFGPNLTRIGSARSYDYLKTSVLNPSADVPEEFGAVTVITRDGQSVTGVRVNEDSFTIQLRLPDQSFVSFDKQALQQETPQTASLMPPYQGNEQDLKDLLAYLASLSGDTAGEVRPEVDRR
jgi:putative heme-binding domain-containing protein